MSSPKRQCMETEEDPAVTNFRRYLRINTMQPNPDYDSAVVFLQGMAAEIGLGCDVLKMTSGLPVVVMSWLGTEPELSSILLNSHIDVVPVFPEHWSHPPFEAAKKENGDIVARGSQDMKCVGMQYIEAIRKMKAAGKRCRRNMFVTFVPDEEIGGKTGMMLFVKTDYFSKLNVGFALDEGYANPTEAFSVFNGERTVLWAQVTCTGDPGHGSQFIENIAAEKLYKVMGYALEFRESEKKKLADNPDLQLGDVTTLNVNIVNGGVQPNVIPADFSVTFDIRLSPYRNFEEFKQLVQSWVDKAGTGCSVTYVQYNEPVGLTPADDSSIWWKTFSTTLDRLGAKYKVGIFPAATDIRYLRGLGIPSLGFSPMNHTPILLHDHNEFLNETIFLKGVDIYVELLNSLGDC